MTAFDEVTIEGGWAYCAGGTMPESSYRFAQQARHLRPYCASWEVANGAWYLKRLRVPDEEHPWFDRECWSQELELILNRRGATLPTFANWLTGKFDLMFGYCCLGKWELTRKVNVCGGFIVADSGWKRNLPRRQLTAEAKAAREKAIEHHTRLLIHRVYQDQKENPCDRDGASLADYYAALISRAKRLPLEPYLTPLTSVDEQELRALAIARLNEQYSSALAQQELERKFPYSAEVRWRGQPAVLQTYVSWCKRHFGEEGFAHYERGDRRHLRFLFRHLYQSSAFGEAWRAKAPVLNMDADTFF